MILTIDITGKAIIDMNMEELTVDVDESELVLAIARETNILELMEYSDITEYVAQVENDKREDLEAMR